MTVIRKALLGAVQNAILTCVTYAQSVPQPEGVPGRAQRVGV